VEKEKADSYLHALAKVMNEKVVEPTGKKKAAVNLAEDTIKTEKKEEKLNDENVSKSQIWKSKDNKQIVDSFNSLIDPKEAEING
jgi:hypothetical protein